LDDTIQANVYALSHLGHKGTQDLRPLLRLTLARLYWARATYGDQTVAIVVRKDVDETARYAQQALEY